MRKILKSIFHSFGLVTNRELQSVKEELSKWKTPFVPPGHYYSPLNDVESLLKDDRTFQYNPYIGEINLNLDAQKVLLEKLSQYYTQLPFTREKRSDLRYYLQNSFFSYSDGVFLYCMMNYIRPTRIIEVGSGYSSALMMDTNDLNFNASVDLTFIEPFPEERLLKLMSGAGNTRLIKSIVQQVDVATFASLEANDILFIDSSHVSKFNSDLNHIIFNILPVLKSGVYIHFHDIFFPFEYPKEWILAGRAWNEAYLVRAFLMNNVNYEVVLFPSMLEHYHEDWLKQHMPLTLELHEKWPGEENFQSYLSIKGQSLWLKKVG